MFFTVLLARTSPDPVMPAGAAGAGGRGGVGDRGRGGRRWRSAGRGSATVPVWTAASAASGGLLLAPGWPGAGRNTS